MYTYENESVAIELIDFYILIVTTCSETKGFSMFEIRFFFFFGLLCYFPTSDVKGKKTNCLSFSNLKAILYFFHDWLTISHWDIWKPLSLQKKKKRSRFFWLLLYRHVSFYTWYLLVCWDQSMMTKNLWSGKVMK